MAARRSPSEIAEFHRQRAAQHQAEADRRLSVAADTTCELMYEAEKSLHKLAAYMGIEGGKDYLDIAKKVEQARIIRWADLRSRRERE